MISGPSDTSDLLNSAERTITHWNSLHGLNRKILINPMHWTRNTLAQAGQRAQDFINEDILFNSDALIAIFKNRFGSDTGKYPSGTLEEIEESIKLGKQTMVFFSDEDVPRSLSGSSDLNQVEDFKRKYLGYYKTYLSQDDFRDKLRDQIDLWINKLETIGDKYFELKKENNPAEVLDYLITLDQINRNNGQIQYFKTSQGDTISIGDKNRFDQFSNRVEFAKMKSRIQELVETGLLEQISENLYSLTNKSYEILKENIV
ncbi:MAG: hypothetical protein MH321_04820 [Leptospiraceae bacterium]|nr:hypothetical protein [Leptospiraceae bacterium]